MLVLELLFIMIIVNQVLQRLIMKEKKVERAGDGEIITGGKEIHLFILNNNCILLNKIEESEEDLFSLFSLIRFSISLVSNLILIMYDIINKYKISNNFFSINIILVLFFKIPIQPKK